MKPLEERFHSMMKPRATATDIQAVIAEIDAEVARLSDAAGLAHAKSLDGAISDADADQARKDEQGLRFAIERWISRKETLAGRFAERTQSDAAQALRKQYEDTVTETVVLAADLKERIPEIFAELTSLLERVLSNNACVYQVNQSKPGGAASITPAEQQARGFIGTGQWPNLNHVSRLTDIRIPRFDGDGFLWPQPEAKRPMQFFDVFGEAERAKQATKAKYVVQRTDNRQGTVSLFHADGVFQLGYQAHRCWLLPQQVEACRAAKMTVTPVDAREAADA
ncbi:hypothetical protein ACFSUK_20945 [Sphingobium scionense]|uniref:Uncharacterized protein n=1 Tax=Sphingobium scionense TaxID=1404341 RepID=A0A7W6LUP9_9SPHN|nr:hypothetical protein [Sphingobium scionense]MBB4149812.1 hypothetical protein [Sphingobium scionense]